VNVEQSVTVEEGPGSSPDESWVEQPQALTSSNGPSERLLLGFFVDITDELAGQGIAILGVPPPGASGLHEDPGKSLG
jgi:hypothetical protein